MTTDRLLDQLNQARRQCKKAKEQMAQAKTISAWREAEEELNFWQGKTSWYEANLKAETPG